MFHVGIVGGPFTDSHTGSGIQLTREVENTGILVSLVAVASEDRLRPLCVRNFDRASYLNLVSQLSIGAVGGGEVYQRDNVNKRPSVRAGSLRLVVCTRSCQREVGFKSISEPWVITRGLIVVACLTHGSMLALRSPI